MDKRLSIFEEHIERRVEEWVGQELDAMLDLLEERLTRAEFIKVAHILAETSDEDSRSRDSNMQA